MSYDLETVDQVATREDAELALRELSYLKHEQARLKDAAEAEISAVNERLALQTKPHTERTKALEDELLAWADANRAELLGSGRKKSVELRNGKIRWRDLKDAVKRLDEVSAKESKVFAGELTLPRGIRIDAETPLIAALQQVDDLIDYHGAVTVSIGINTTAATKARVLQQLDDDDLEAIGHRFEAGEEYVTVEPAEFVRE